MTKFKIYLGGQELEKVLELPFQVSPLYFQQNKRQSSKHKKWVTTFQKWESHKPHFIINKTVFVTNFNSKDVRWIPCADRDLEFLEPFWSKCFLLSLSPESVRAKLSLDIGISQSWETTSVNINMYMPLFCFVT